MATTAVPRPAYAGDELTTEEKKRVKSLIQSARSAYEDGNYSRAARLLESASTIDPRPAFHYRIGLSYQNAGKPKKALDHLRSYLEKVPEASNRGEVERRIERLEGQVERSRERVWSEQSESDRTWAWFATAAGGTGVLATAVFGGLFAGANASYRDLEARSRTLQRSNTNVDTLAKRRNTYLTLTYVGGTIAAVGGGVATYLWLSKSPDTSADSTGARLVPR
ncbi:MAG: tetratricopeptide repeat protein, partial [Bradymonadaceae bacterium]